METILFTDKAGSKRKGILVQCKICGQEFLTRIDQPAKYCSQQCSGHAAKKQVCATCAQCNKTFDRQKSKVGLGKSGLDFCSRKCKDSAQKIGGIKAIMPPHYGTANGMWSYRKQFQKEELICHRCGYAEFNCSVSIHHVDHDRTNNKKENLLPLCANCHTSLHHEGWQLKELIMGS